MGEEGVYPVWPRLGDRSCWEGSHCTAHTLSGSRRSEAALSQITILHASRGCWDWLEPQQMQGNRLGRQEARDAQGCLSPHDHGLWLPHG